MTDRTEPTAGELRQLLVVVLEALTLPYDTDGYDRRILERAALTRTVVGAALAEDPADLTWNTDYLRGKLRAEESDAAVRRSVDEQFPAVARFLADERAGRGEER